MGGQAEPDLQDGLIRTRLSNSQLRWTQTPPFLPQNRNATHIYQPTRCWHANITHRQENRDFPAQSQNLSAPFHHRLSSPPAGFHTLQSKDISVQTHSHHSNKQRRRHGLKPIKNHNNLQAPKHRFKKKKQKTQNHQGIKLTLKSASCWLMVSTSVPTTHCKASFSSAAVVMWLSSFRRL